MMRIIATLLILISVIQVKSQDAIVTQKFNNPLFVNPALTGNGEKLNRFTFLYRDQWRAALVPYSTTYLGFDRQMFKQNNNQISAGLQFFYDKAANGSLTTFNPTISMAYTKFLSQERFAISGGLQIGFLQTSVDASKIEFNNQYGPGGFDPTISSGESFENGSFVTFGLGANVNAKVYGKSNIDVGFAIHNPHKPTYDFSAYLGDARPARYSAYFNSELFAASQWSLSPSFYFITQETAKEFHTSLRLNYYTKSEKTPVKLSVGAGYRNNDAVLTYVGAKVKDIQVGFSYDINTSGFADATNSKGGYELSLQYEFELRKNKIVEIDTTDLMDSIFVDTTLIEEEVIEPIEPEDTTVIEPIDLTPEPVVIIDDKEDDIPPEINAVVNSLPLQLFFDNNQPAIGSNDYLSSYNQYISRKGTYASEIGTAKAEEWFKKITLSKDQLDRVVNELESLAQQGFTIKLTLKGYTSPLASAEYNELLAERRIESVINYMKVAKAGALASYIANGTILIIEAPIGEGTSPLGINDQLSNKKQSIFNTQAAFERRVEIIAVDIVK